MFLMPAIQTGVRGNLTMDLPCKWLEMLSISSCVLGIFELLPLKKLCSVHLPISSLGHWFFWEFSFSNSLCIPLSDV
jgi:hypothetical protein